MIRQAIQSSRRPTALNRYNTKHKKSRWILYHHSSWDFFTTSSYAAVAPSIGVGSHGLQIRKHRMKRIPAFTLLAALSVAWLITSKAQVPKAIEATRRALWAAYLRGTGPDPSAISPQIAA
jgi:hypothetical protein